MERDESFLGCRGDCEWMPLPVGNLWDVDEEVLSRTVVKARFFKLDFHGITGMENNFCESGLLPSARFTNTTLDKVKGESRHGPGP